ncbi:hypothetical protein CN172_21830, partial [Sinorhizobium meliloti]|uniref:polysaccharide biosynthesis/export family protein n=2 Tax=Rhizobium meliloti TaxID=382 RepID=UPI000FE09943
MDHVSRSEPTCDSPAFPWRHQRTTATPRRRIRQGSVRATLNFLSFCLITLLGSPAGGQPTTDNGLASQDALEIHVLEWHALLGGVAEAMLSNNTFTIGTDGTLELPEIGRLSAAGLGASELAKLITERLQAKGGKNQRPIMTVQRRRPAGEVPSSLATTPVEGPPPAAQPRVAEPTATEQLQTLEQDRSRAGILLGDLTAARMELEEVRREARAARQAARDAVIRHNRRLDAERQRAVTLTQELNAARANLEVMKAKLELEANATRDWETAVGTVSRARELVAREHAKRVALEAELLAARKEVDAIKSRAQNAGSEREEVLRSELAAARRDLDVVRRAAEDADGQARRAADATAEQRRALEKQRQRATGLARDLSAALRQIEHW